MSPDDPRHGQRRGYYAHRADGEDACEPCKRAAAAAEQGYVLARMRGVPMRIPAIGTRRRLRALQALGWTITELAEQMGESRTRVEKWCNEARDQVYPSTAARVAMLYDRLCMTVPDGPYAARNRGMAARKGYAPPLAWDNIDDPDETPSGAASHRLHVVRERTFASADHRACPRCGVIRQTHVDHTRGDLCRDCHEALPTEAVSA